MSADMVQLVLGLWVIAFAATMGWLVAVTGRRGGAEVVDFEPSDQFEMPEAMGIDYMPETEEGKP